MGGAGHPSRELAQSLTEASLIARLRSTEHDFVERKPLKQNGEWLQAAVAFANSAPVGWPSVLFIGVDDKGNPQAPPDKLESLLTSISDTLDKAYPPIYRHVVPLVMGDLACAAVIVLGSPDRPHFAGRAYVRSANMTKDASEQQFDALVADRLSVAREIRKCIDQRVIVEHFRTGYSGVQARTTGVVVACGPHFVTLRVGETGTPGTLKSYPLRRIDLSFNHSEEMLVLQAIEF